MISKVILITGVLIFVFSSTSCNKQFKVIPTDQESTANKELLNTQTEGLLTETETDFKVIFTGEDCTVTGPEEVQAGEISFKFIDMSGKDAYLWMIYLDEDKTFQDNLDLQNEPGEWYEKRPWAHYATQISKRSQIVEDYRIDIETWILDNEKEHVILCYHESPKRLWFAAPIRVVESSDD